MKNLNLRPCGENVPYLEETLCGAPSTACRLLPSPPESHHWESPPTKSAALGLYGVLGMPKGGGRLVLPPPKDGLCGRLAVGKSYHLSSGRQPPCSGRRMAEAARRVLLLGPLGHTTHSVDRCGRRVPWGTKRGKADCRPRRSTALSRRPLRRGCVPFAGRPPVTCNISPALKHAPVANPGER